MPRKRSHDNFSRILLLLSATVVATILVVAVTATYIQARELSEHRMAVIRTQQLITLLTRLESAMYMVESQQRGYLITGRRKYLEPFRRNSERLLSIFATVESMAGNSGLRAQRLVDMKSHIDKKLAELGRTMELRRLGHYQEAKNVVLTDHSQEQMEAFVRCMREMKREENRILRIQSAQLELAAASALDRLILLSFVALVAFVTGFFYITRMDASRRRSRLTQQVLFEVSYVMAKTEDLSTSIAGILEDICEQFNWQVGLYLQESENGDFLECSGFYSKTPEPELEEMTRVATVKKGEGLAGLVWQDENAHWSKDVSEYNPADLIKSADLHSGFAFPLFSGETFIGIFAFYSSQIEKPDRDLVEAFSLVGAEIGQLIERRDIEDKLQKSMRELAQAKGVMDSVLDNMSSGVIYAEKKGGLRLYNRPLEQILGTGIGEKSVDYWMDKVFYADDGKPLKYADLPMVRALEGASTDNVAITYVNEEVGDNIVINVNGRPVRDDVGNIIGGVVVVDDITARHEAEKRVSEFYSMVSHELRTPLTSIKGSLALLEGGKGGELSPKARRLVTMGRKECDRLVRLINDILDIRKIEAGKLEIKPAPLSPLKLVDEVMESMNAYAQEHSVRLVRGEICEDKIFADRDKVAQILTNLISNAVKFSPEEGEVMLSTDPKDDRIRFSVCDQGPGIGEKDQQKLFKIFQQLDSTDSRPKGGTGLGLAICKSLVEQHGGEIGLDSAPGEGSIFWFEIKRYKEFPEAKLVEEKTV